MHPEGHASTSNYRVCLNARQIEWEGMDILYVEPCPSQQRIEHRSGSLACAMGDQHVEIRSSPGAITRARRKGHSCEPPDHEKPCSTRHRSATTLKDLGAFGIRPVMEDAFQHVRVATRRCGTEEVTRDELTSIREMSCRQCGIGSNGRVGEVVHRADECIAVLRGTAATCIPIDVRLKGASSANACSRSQSPSPDPRIADGEPWGVGEG